MRSHDAAQGRAAIAVVAGTRPELVKLAGILRQLGDRAGLVHTGQHYDPAMADAYATALGVPEPLAQLHIGGTTRDEQLAAGAAGLCALFADWRPDAVVVQGDTNSTLAGARAARACGLPLVHVEAGLRSFDDAMPEEHNRIETDHLSDLCLAPTEWAAKHLADEGISGDRVVVTGNTGVDAVLEALPPQAERTAAVARLGLEPGGYVLATLHRPENTDTPATLTTILRQLAGLAVPVVLPMHPRTASRIEAAGAWDLVEGLVLVPPLDHAAFLALAAESRLLVSDSGGVQEEASVLKRPVVVVRRSTERPEVHGTFARLVSPDDVAAVTTSWLAELALEPDRLTGLPSPYGDGTATQRSIAAIEHFLSSRR